MPQKMGNPDFDYQNQGKMIFWGIFLSVKIALHVIFGFNIGKQMIHCTHSLNGVATMREFGMVYVY